MAVSQAGDLVEAALKDIESPEGQALLAAVKQKLAGESPQIKKYLTYAFSIVAIAGAGILVVSGHSVDAGGWAGIFGAGGLFAREYTT